MLEQLLANMYPGLSITVRSFTYTMKALLLLAGTNTSDIIAIDGGSDFIILASTFEADIAGAAQLHNTRVLPAVTILLTDSGPGGDLMDNPVPIPCMFGTGQFPYVWPQPRLMIAKSTLKGSFVSFEAAVTNSIRLQFHGVKVFVD